MSDLAQVQRELKLTQALLAAHEQTIAAHAQTIASKDEIIASLKKDSAQHSRDTLIAAAAPPQQKRKRVLQRWDSNDTMDKIFAAVGDRDWLYVASTSRRFRGLYLSFCKRTARRKRVTFAYQTDWRSAVLTIPRLQMAFTHGLRKAVFALPESAFGTHVIEYSSDPIAVLTLCEEMPWTEELAVVAVQNQHRVPGLLQWVLDSGCPWNAMTVMREIIVSGDLGWAEGLDLLKWLWKKEPDLSDEENSLLLENAGIIGDVHAAKWLRNTVKAPWPDKFWCYMEDSEHVNLAGPPVRNTLLCWALNTLQWARSSGAPWGEGGCQRFNEAWYKQGSDADCAQEVYDWAHQNGVPCSCKKQSKAR